MGGALLDISFFLFLWLFAVGLVESPIFLLAPRGTVLHDFALAAAKRLHDFLVAVEAVWGLGWLLFLFSSSFFLSFSVLPSITIEQSIPAPFCNYSTFPAQSSIQNYH